MVALGLVVGVVTCDYSGKNGKKNNGHDLTKGFQKDPLCGLLFGASPAVGDAAAVASHSEALLQVRRKARGGDASAAVGTNALFVFPLVVNLAEHIQARLVHDFFTFGTRGGGRTVKSDVD